MRTKWEIIRLDFAKDRPKVHPNGSDISDLGRTAARIRTIWINHPSLREEP